MKTLEKILLWGAVAVGLVVVLRMIWARTQTVVQQRQTNPLISAIDNAAPFLNSITNFVDTIWNREDSGYTGISDSEISADYVDSLPVYMR